MRNLTDNITTDEWVDEASLLNLKASDLSGY